MKFIRRVFIYGFVISLLTSITNLFSFSTYAAPQWSAVLLQFISLPLVLLAFFGIGITVILIILYKIKPAYLKDIEYNFTHWGVERTGGDGHSSIPWRQFVKYTETDNFIILFMNNSLYHISQKRMFASKAEVDLFRNFIEEKIKNAA